MTQNSELPFDALRPFKSQLEDFVPRDTLPWEAQAVQLLRCRTDTGYIGLRPFAEIDAHIEWLAGSLGLAEDAAILDIGCGPGLYGNPLGHHGFTVTGIDIAQPLLDFAQAEADDAGLPCTYLRQALQDLPTLTEFHAAFDAILLINTTINMLTADEMALALDGVARALKPGGHFIGEFSTLPPNFATAPPTESLEMLPRSPWGEGFHALMTRQLNFPDTNERVTHYLLLPPNAAPREYWTRATLYAPDALRSHLEMHGFHFHQVFSPTLGQPYRGDTSTCIVWAGFG